MPSTYETPRGVWFSPDEVRLPKCLKCAAPTNRRSPRMITHATREDAPFGVHRFRILSARNVLTLCEKCDSRWTMATSVAVAGIAIPFAVPMGFEMLESNLKISVSSQLYIFAVLGGIVFGIAMVIWALRASIRVRTIDDDGLLGLDNIHRDVRSEIVEMGDAYKAEHA
jgi:hypothetical protein